MKNKKNRILKDLKELKKTKKNIKKEYNYKPLVTVDLKSKLENYSVGINLQNFDEELVAYATCASGGMYCV